jgi:hypothetical protein
MISVFYESEKETTILVKICFGILDNPHAAFLVFRGADIVKHFEEMLAVGNSKQK